MEESGGEGKEGRRGSLALRVQTQTDGSEPTCGLTRYLPSAPCCASPDMHAQVVEWTPPVFASDHELTAAAQVWKGHSASACRFAEQHF